MAERITYVGGGADRPQAWDARLKDWTQARSAWLEVAVMILSAVAVLGFFVYLQWLGVISALSSILNG